MSEGVDRGMVVDPNMPPIVPTDQAPTEGHMPPAAAVQVQDIGSAVVNVAEHHAFHVVTDPGRRFLSKRWVALDDCEHLVVREVPVEPEAVERTAAYAGTVQDQDTDWHEGALAACTAEADRDLIVVASSDTDTGEFIYVRCTPDLAATLIGRLQSALVEGAA